MTRSRYSGCRPLWLGAGACLLLTLATFASAVDDHAASNMTKVDAPTPVVTRAVYTAAPDESDDSESAADSQSADTDDVKKKVKTRSYDSGSSGSSYGGSSDSYAKSQPEYLTNSYDQEYQDYDKDTFKVGGYGKSTVLKGVKHKVIPWVREGVQYIPKKFYVYGQVHTKTPYFKKVTTSVQHLGPGKTRLYKTTTGVEAGEVVNKELPYLDKSSKYWQTATNYNPEEDNSYDTGGDSYGGNSGGSSYSGGGSS